MSRNTIANLMLTSTMSKALHTNVSIKDTYVDLRNTTIKSKGIVIANTDGFDGDIVKISHIHLSIEDFGKELITINRLNFNDVFLNIEIKNGQNNIYAWYEKITKDNESKLSRQKLFIVNDFSVFSTRINIKSSLLNDTIHIPNIYIRNIGLKDGGLTG